MFDLGIQELIVIFVVALIVFGPKRLPELGRTLGKGILELKKAMEGVKEQIHAESEMTQGSIESPRPEEKKEGVDSESGVESGTAENRPEAKEINNGTQESQGSSETDKFYRAEEKASQERKEDPVDGR